MLAAPKLITRCGWNARESEVTDESVYLSRRSVLKTASLAGAAFGVGGIAPAMAALPPGVSDALDKKYTAGRALTPEKDATTYNNYYEIDTDKDIWQGAQKIPQRPWQIEVGGLCANKKTYAIDDLLKLMPLEERIYRHRCVEARAMTVPWSGFPLSKLVDAAQPTADAKYIVFTTLADDKVMPGLADPTFPWPYLEGLTIAEARNELAFIGTGMYGRSMPPQDGGPIRLVVPWKYGFKSAKALVKITFAKAQPMNFWQAIAPTEYGFWANVNPAVPHPRWSQARERLLGSGEMVPTQIYNGYGEYVAGLYANLKNQRLFV
jgi:sulfoxide reductase catalytic subunit YedY